MLKSSGAMAAATLTSRLLGMVREIVYAHFMGDTWVAGVFKFAFQIPNLFRRLLGEGALTAAFIPVFKEKEKRQGEKEMWRAANAVVSGLVIAASAIIGLVMLGLSLVLAAHHFIPKTELTLQLLRVMFPYMLFVCLAAAFMGMLNARGHFFIPALGAAALNVVMIASVLWLAPKFGTGLPPELRLPRQIFALAYGVLAAGVAQAAFKLPTLWRDGFRYQWISPWGNETVRLVVTRMIPGTIGVAAFQINVALVGFLAIYVNPQINASFDYAVRLMELPQGMFGISLATYLLTTLSALAVDKNYPEFRATLRHGLGTLLFANLIAAILLVVLAEPIVRLLFEHGDKFTAASTDRAAFALQCLAPGLVAFSSVNVLARAFFALGDTKTPMKVSIFCLTLNMLLAAAAILPFEPGGLGLTDTTLHWIHQAPKNQEWGQGGLGLANTMTSVCNAGLLAFALRRKLGKLEMAPLRATFFPLACSGLFAALVAWAAWNSWEHRIGHATIALEIGAVFVPAGIAALVYGLAALALKVPAAKEMLDFALAKFRK